MNRVVRWAANLVFVAVGTAFVRLTSWFDMGFPMTPGGGGRAGGVRGPDPLVRLVDATRHRPVGLGARRRGC